MRNHILLAAAALALGCAGGTEPARTAAPQSASATTPRAVVLHEIVEAEDYDVPGADSIRALIRDVYDVISGPAGQERNWDRMHNLFAGQARLSAMMHPEPPDAEPRPAMMIMGVDDWIRRSEPFLMREGFFETEVYSEIERYGNVAQVWSTYESRIGSPETDPIDRGINSFQLVNIDGRWYVYSILWHSERAGAGTIPDAYLP